MPNDILPERGAREVAYASRKALMRSIRANCPASVASLNYPYKAGGVGMRQTDAQIMETEEALEDDTPIKYVTDAGGDA